MNIAIFGLGYVGCVSLGCLAKNGHKVIGVDVNEHKVSLINSGKATIIENEIDEIIDLYHKKKMISATSNYEKAITKSDVSIICVGTPSTEEGHLNLLYIYKVAKEIGKSLKNQTAFHTVSIRSTVLPGTNKKVGEIIEEESGKKINIDFGVVSNPEFLREGTAVKDYFNPAVTVLGSENSKSLEIMSSLYNKIDAPIVKVNVEEAELIKYVNNSFHALKIVFANEIGNICKRMNIDSRNVMKLMCMDDVLNISSYYLKPGFAYGGSCLPKDLKALSTLAHDSYLESPVINSIANSNELQKRLVIDMIEAKGITKIGILGLSFKAGTDDLRYSPIIDVAEYFLGKGMEIGIFDKNVSLSKLTGTNKEFIDEKVPHLSNLMIDSLQDVVEESELIIITHNLEGISDLIELESDKFFIDLVGAYIGESSNYEGICW